MAATTIASTAWTMRSTSALRRSTAPVVNGARAVAIAGSDILSASNPFDHEIGGEIDRE